MDKHIRALSLTVFLFCFHQVVTTAQVTRAERPVENFMALWSTFSDHYANFELKQVDWDQVYEQYRPLVNDSMSNRALFETMCSMLQLLNDGHVTLTADRSLDEIKCGPPYNFKLDEAFPTVEDWEAFEDVIDTTLRQAGFSTVMRAYVNRATNFQFRVSERFGYLRLDEMTEAFTLGRFNLALHRAMSRFKSFEGLIIDLRFNGGGSDEIAYRLASRLMAQEDTLGHYVRTRIEGTDQYTGQEYYEIMARGRDRFTGPIVILTSDFTASAAEVFVLLMKDLPRVSQVGDTTEGIFSDMFEFRLPNRWEVSLSHQQFFSRDGINYEGLGLTPDVMVINTPADLKSGVDPVIIAALARLDD
ncbi:MAG: S41 family peptidase [Bacteroidota bacterium]